MAGTITITEETYSTVKKIKFEWTSDAAGAADGATIKAYSGEVIRLVTIPGGGANQPTDLYDAVMNDEDNTDVFMGAGANRSNASTQQVLASSLGCVANDKLSLSVTNAGNSKSGTVYLYIR